MTQEEKDILLKDLCARLPFGVKVQSYSYEYDVETIETLREIDSDGYMSTLEGETLKHITKPYLFPLSSMTEEQREEFVKFADYESRLEDCGRHKELYYYDLVGHENKLYPNSDAIDWLNKNHFDYRGLIEKGLANDATGLDIY